MCSVFTGCIGTNLSSVWEVGGCGGTQEHGQQPCGVGKRQAGQNKWNHCLNIIV